MGKSSLSPSTLQMALFVAKRVKETIPHLIMPIVLRSNTSHQILHSFSQTFRRTPVLPSFFSTFRVFSTQNLYDPIDFSDHSNHSLKPLEPGILELFQRAKQFSSECEAMAFLDGSVVRFDAELLCSAIWALRDDWRLAYLVFKWGEKLGCCAEKARSFMIWVLGDCKKFNIAWCLIHDLYRSSVDIRPAMLIMIDRYAAANNPGEAIKSFDVMETFRMSLDVEAFYCLLSILCKHGNIEEAEEVMLKNKKLFPLETEGFNIILNGWCNILPDVFEAKRVWREMSNCCISPDATSYTHLVSCFSKVGNLFDSLRLYDEMKKRGWVPGYEVYNSLMYVLTRENCLKEALKILEKMKELGLNPDSVSYNSMIRPLCEARKLAEARIVLEMMMRENLNPTIETYHSFLKEADFEGTFEILKNMKEASLSPNDDTFLISLDRFLKLAQPENALKIWYEMKQYVVPNSSHYTILVKGLAVCGCLVKARELYTEMISNGLDDPRLKKLIKEQEHGNRSKKRGSNTNKEGRVVTTQKRENDEMVELQDTIKKKSLIESNLKPD